MIFTATSYHLAALAGASGVGPGSAPRDRSDRAGHDRADHPAPARRDRARWPWVTVDPASGIDVAIDGRSPSRKDPAMKSHLPEFDLRRAALLAGACLALPLAHCGTAPGDAPSEASTSGEAAVAEGATIAPVLAPGKCLDVAWASRDDGAEIQLWDCNGGAQEAWAYAGGMLSVYGDKCLDVKDGVDQNGARLQIWDCTPGNANQQWVRRGNAWEWAGHGKCLDVPGGITQAGTRLQIWDCLDNANQQWSGGAVASSPPPSQFTS
jgi:hypothetical protein